MPPKPGPPPRRVSRRTVVRRRLLALAAVVLAGGVVFAIVKITGGESSSPTPTTTPAVVLVKPFRIVFPEGFTREEMAHRVQVVAKIAQGKSKKRVRLSPTGYLAWSSAAPA